MMMLSLDDFVGQVWLKHKSVSWVKISLVSRKKLYTRASIIDIKNQLKNSGCKIPFGTVQTIGYLLQNPDQNLLNQMDWLGYNVYPFFSNLGGGSSRDSLRAQIGQLRNKYGGSFSKFFIT